MSLAIVLLSVIAGLAGLAEVFAVSARRIEARMWPVVLVLLAQIVSVPFKEPMFLGWIAVAGWAVCAFFRARLIADRAEERELQDRFERLFGGGL